MKLKIDIYSLNEKSEIPCRMKRKNRKNIKLKIAGGSTL